MRRGSYHSASVARLGAERVQLSTRTYHLAHVCGFFFGTRVRSAEVWDLSRGILIFGRRAEQAHLKQGPCWTSSKPLPWRTGEHSLPRGLQQPAESWPANASVAWMATSRHRLNLGDGRVAQLVVAGDAFCASTRPSPAPAQNVGRAHTTVQVSSNATAPPAADDHATTATSSPCDVGDGQDGRHDPEKPPMQKAKRPQRQQIQQPGPAGRKAQQQQLDRLSLPCKLFWSLEPPFHPGQIATSWLSHRRKFARNGRVAGGLQGQLEGLVQATFEVVRRGPGASGRTPGRSGSPFSLVAPEKPSEREA